MIVSWGRLDRRVVYLRYIWHSLQGSSTSLFLRFHSKKLDLTHWVIPDDVRVVVGSDENPVTCWTGDNTHAYTEKSDIMDGAVIEMEGYSFAKLPINEHRKGTFQQKTLLIKWISDGGDENVGEEWAENADGIPWDDVISILDANYN